MFNSKDLKKNLHENHLNEPTLIIIRGPASSGKSSVGKHLMKLINNMAHNESSNHLHDNPFFLFPYEDLLLFHMMDGDFLVNGKKSHKGFHIERNENGDIIDFKGSPWAFKLYETYQNTLNNYMENNFNIICEGNFLNIENIKNTFKKYQTYKIVIFSLNLSLELLEKRENNRNDRDKGFAKLQFDFYQSTLKNFSHQYIIPVNETSSIESTSNEILEIYKNNKHFYINEVLEII